MTLQVATGRIGGNQSAAQPIENAVAGILTEKSIFLGLHKCSKELLINLTVLLICRMCGVRKRA